MSAISAQQGGTLTTTFHHPFYDITQQEFVQAEHLKVGDQLQTTTGRAQVTDVRLFHANTTTYDLTIDSLHTFYVVAGNTPVLVHNNNGGDECLIAGGGTTPHGFTDEGAAAEFNQTLNSGLGEAGYSGTQAVFQGSSVTGVGFKSGLPFGDHSDYDIALGGEDLFNAAKEAGIGLRSGGTRTGPLNPAQLEQLGLSDMQARLEGMAGREVHFMVYQTIDGAVGRSPSMLVPPNDDLGGP